MARAPPRIFGKRFDNFMSLRHDADLKPAAGKAVFQLGIVSLDDIFQRMLQKPVS